MRNLQFSYDAKSGYSELTAFERDAHDRDRVRTLRPLARALPLVMVVAGCLISLLSFGPRSVMGLFLAPMTEAHGWSRELFALAIAIQNIMWGFGQPIAGAIADRWGIGPSAGRRRADLCRRSRAHELGTVGGLAASLRRRA